MIILMLAIVSSVNAQNTVIAGGVVSTHEEEAQSQDDCSIASYDLATYLESYKLIEAKGNSPYKDWCKGRLASSVANFHWSSDSNDQYNERLLVAIMQYQNGPIEDKYPIAEYLGQLSILFNDNETEQGIENKLSTTAWIASFISWIPQRKYLAKKASSLAKKPAKGLRGAWQRLKLGSIWFVGYMAANGVIVGVWEGKEALEELINGHMLDPATLLLWVDAIDVQYLAKMSCEVNQRLSDNPSETELGEINSLFKEDLEPLYFFLSGNPNTQGHLGINAYDPFTPGRMGAIGEEDKDVLTPEIIAPLKEVLEAEVALLEEGTGLQKETLEATIALLKEALEEGRELTIGDIVSRNLDIRYDICNQDNVNLNLVDQYISNVKLYLYFVDL